MKRKSKPPKTVKARLVFTARGEQLITESGDGACFDCEEIAAWDDYDVTYGTKCGICEKVIEPQA